MTRRLLTLLLVVLSVPAVRADVKLHELFTDNMVLQAGRANPVWGTADAGEKVSVKLTRDAQVHTVEQVTGADGRWTVQLPVTTASDAAFTLTIQGKNTITLKNVLVGEVWVCSGQSNMAWEVRQSADPEIAKASRDPGLRLYSVPRTTSMTPLANVPHQQGQYTKWYEAGQDTVSGFSAVAYHFGRHLRETRKVPIGLIHTSWGGTPAESWTSRGALDAVPELRYYHEKLATAIKNFDPDKAKADYEKA